MELRILALSFGGWGMHLRILDVERLTDIVWNIGDISREGTRTLKCATRNFGKVQLIFKIFLLRSAFAWKWYTPHNDTNETHHPNYAKNRFVFWCGVFARVELYCGFCSTLEKGFVSWKKGGAVWDHRSTFHHLGVPSIRYNKCTNDYFIGFGRYMKQPLKTRNIHFPSWSPIHSGQTCLKFSSMLCLNVGPVSNSHDTNASLHCSGCVASVHLRGIHVRTWNSSVHVIDW